MFKKKLEIQDSKQSEISKLKDRHKELISYIIRNQKLGPELNLPDFILNNYKALRRELLQILKNAKELESKKLFNKYKESLLTLDKIYLSKKIKLIINEVLKNKNPYYDLEYIENFFNKKLIEICKELGIKKTFIEYVKNLIPELKEEAKRTKLKHSLKIPEIKELIRYFIKQFKTPKKN